MRGNAVISVIVPVYNVEAYIHKALDSLRAQTYKSFEAFIIDDGSTDESGRICATYAEKDRRFTVLTYDNGGYPAAINRGLSAAINRGVSTYMAFLDPDDWIESNYFENAVKALRETNADIFISNFYKNYPDGREEKRVQETPRPLTELLPEEAFLHMFQREGYFAACVVAYWNKLFNKRFFAEANIRMDEDLRAGGDCVVTCECVSQAKKIVYDGRPYYHYYQRPGSLVRESASNEFLILQAVEKVREMVLRKSLGINAIPYINRFYAFHASIAAERALAMGDANSFMRAKNAMLKYCNDYIESNESYPERLERYRFLLQTKVD